MCLQAKSSWTASASACTSAQHAQSFAEQHYEQFQKYCGVFPFIPAGTGRIEVVASHSISPSCRHFQNVIGIFDLMHNTESTEDLFFPTSKQFFGGGHGFSDESVISCQYFSTGSLHYLTGGLF